MRFSEMDGFLKSYRKDPKPDLVPEFLALIREQRMLAKPETELPFSAAVLAFAEAHPDRAGFWEQAERDMFHKARRILKYADRTRPGLNDAALVRWRILGKDEDAKEIAIAAGKRDQRGATARWMIKAAKDPDLVSAVAKHRDLIPADLLSEMPWLRVAN